MSSPCIESSVGSKSTPLMYWLVNLNIFAFNLRTVMTIFSVPGGGVVLRDKSPHSKNLPYLSFSVSWSTLTLKGLFYLLLNISVPPWRFVWIMSFIHLPFGPKSLQHVAKYAIIQQWDIHFPLSYFSAEWSDRGMSDVLRLPSGQKTGLQ